MTIQLVGVDIVRVPVSSYILFTSKTIYFLYLDKDSKYKKNKVIIAVYRVVVMESFMK